MSAARPSKDDPPPPARSAVLSAQAVRQQAQDACEMTRDTRAQTHTILSHTRQVLHEAEALVQQRHARREDEAERAAGRAPADAGVPAQPLAEPPVWILIVDDNEGMRDLLTRMVHRLGYAVVTAADGWEALSRLQAQRVEIMLLDLMMPEIDGFAVCRALQREPLLSPPYIIITSARSALEDRVDTRALGAADYLTKPFSLQDLRARLEVGVRHVRAARSATRVETLGRGVDNDSL